MRYRIVSAPKFLKRMPNGGITGPLPPIFTAPTQHGAADSLRQFASSMLDGAIGHNLRVLRGRSGTLTVQGSHDGHQAIFPGIILALHRYGSRVDSEGHVIQPVITTSLL